MKLSWTSENLRSNITKIIEWSVCLGFCALAAWCLWVYYDVSQQIQQSEAATALIETTVKENLRSKVGAAQQSKQLMFSAPPEVNRDPFQ
jgi:predicted negative regulator of RcsB-dependent stress response